MTLRMVQDQRTRTYQPSHGRRILGNDVLVANNNSWTVEIPPSIANGTYVLRHEIVALHVVNSLDECQNYQQFICLAITSSGTANPPSVVATTFYHETDQGIHIDIMRR
jgi:cellulase